ncbi:ABC-2 family transporter protein [Candidatus Woesebacteria bacterium]|nr:ABC-2 family transporter protein [Candidatus Woesebacteria bacterium]
MQLSRCNYYWRLFWKFRALRLMLLFEYRSDFFFWTVISIIWTAFNFFFFSLLLRVSENIAGWTKPELYVLLATFTILDSFTWSFFNKIMRFYTQAIFNGSFDRFLLQPADPQVILSIHDNTFTHVPRFLIGIAVLWWAVGQTGNHPSILHILSYIILLCCSFLIIYNIWFAVATLAFYVERLDNINEIVPGLRRVYQVPRQLYQGVSALVFTLVLPFGLVSSIPAELLVNRWQLSWILYFLVFTVLSTIFTRVFFFKTLSRYSGVGS